MKNQQSNIVAIDINAVKSRMLQVRGQQVLLDRDVAELYGVETKRVNEAVRNNPDKFPLDYIFPLAAEELEILRSKFSSANLSPKSRAVPKAFTEKGLYMLATILKSPVATQATLTIVETFAQIRELARTMQAVAEATSEPEKKSLMQRSGELIGEVIGAQLDTTTTETEIELNFAVVKIKHKVKREKK